MSFSVGIFLHACISVTCTIFVCDLLLQLFVVIIVSCMLHSVPHGCSHTAFVMSCTIFQFCYDEIDHQPVSQSVTQSFQWYVRDVLQYIYMYNRAVNIKCNIHPYYWALCTALCGKFAVSSVPFTLIHITCLNPRKIYTWKNVLAQCDMEFLLFWDSSTFSKGASSEDIKRIVKQWISPMWSV